MQLMFLLVLMNSEVNVFLSVYVFITHRTLMYVEQVEFFPWKFVLKIAGNFSDINMARFKIRLTNSTSIHSVQAAGNWQLRP